MASIKVKFKPSSVVDKEGLIYYQIVHERRVRQLFTEHKIFSSEWDGNKSKVTPPETSDRKHHIISISERIHRDVERLAKIDRKLYTERLFYSTDDIIDEYNHYIREYSLFHFTEGLIETFRQNGKTRTSETYKSALSSFKNFRKNEDVMLDCLTSEIMEAYEAWQCKRGVTPNTISFYTRILRAVYNRAIENDIIENRHPFRHVYTGIDKTIKRALPLTAIKKIKSLDLSLAPSLDFARDMFLMSFYLRGMSFIDMAFLKKSDLKNGYITYCRRKTGRQITIKWTKEMQTILDKYPENTSNYLLPIIRGIGVNERCVYRNVGYNINRSLKNVATMVEIKISLTLYVARHSWASAAKAKGIPLSVISEGMGHVSETTTQIYLTNLDTSVVDKANAIILKSL